jgi:PAS domain S-box-containing protein
MSSIVVLDDRPADRELIGTVLRYGGHVVTEAGTAGEALLRVRSGRPDLVIADLLTPETSGDEFVRQLRADPHVGQTKVVLFSASSDEHQARRVADEYGAAWVLRKPVDPEEMIRVVGEVLGSSASPNGASPNGGAALSERFDREELRVLNSKLVQKTNELEVLHDDVRRSEREAAEALTLLETVLSNSPVGFGFVDREFRVLRLNETLASVFGVREADLLGMTIAEVAPDRWPELEPLYRGVLERGEAVINSELTGASDAAAGEIRHWLASYYPVRLEGEEIGVGLVVVDVTERKQADDFRAVVMQTMAEGMFVTDAENRLMFMNPAASRLLGFSEEELRGKPVHEVIHNQRADGSPLAAEDRKLRKVLQEGSTIRVSDDAFTRRDGSSFPVAFSAAPLLSGDTVRGGVVVFRDVTDEKAEETRVERELAKLAWVGRIRDALDEDRLVLYEQPIVPLGGGPGSVELLVRMIGQRGEVIPPASFLPAAEEYKLIDEIDEWVLTQGLRIAAAGRHVHINLSADSISRTDLLPQVESLLRETGAAASNVVFEITETALMTDIRAGELFTEALVELGCGIALDDFGTGYGSLIYLQKLPITFLKIDIAFVRDLMASTASQHVVKAIVNLAQGFGQRTVAEGVEDAETLELLRVYGVDFVQGFHTGRPVPLAA